METVLSERNRHKRNRFRQEADIAAESRYGICQLKKTVSVDEGALAARDWMHHQYFALLTCDCLDALARRHIKRLRTSLSFVFGDYLIHFFHVSSGWIVLENRRIAVGGKRQNLRFHSLASAKESRGEV